METMRVGWRRPAWAVMAILLSLPLVGARCPEDDGSGSGGSSNGLGGDGEDSDDGTPDDGDPGEEGNIDVDFEVCTESDCGPALGMPNWECADGSLAGPTGACIPTADGACGWEIAYCDDDPNGGGGDPGGCDPATGENCCDAANGMMCCDPTADGNCCDPATGVNCDPGGGGGDPCNTPDGNCGCVCDGPAPGMPNWICEDGTVGGPSCEPDADGTCGWTIRDCPPDDGGCDATTDPAGDPDCGNDACEPDECPDPAPGMPNWICDDGTVGGPVCERTADGLCGWVIRDCPDGACDSTDPATNTCECTSCPDPAPGMPNWICPDGSIGGPSCQPDESGTCGWVILECPEDPADCTDSEPCDDCPGPAPGMMNWLCENGCVGGPACLYDDDGSCSWHILDCE